MIQRLERQFAGRTLSLEIGRMAKLAHGSCLVQYGDEPAIPLDFDADIYGEEVRVDFIQYLRQIEPFATVGALVAQMRDDVEAARTAVDANLQIS